ncbi:MAG: putative integral rane protein SCJ12 [Frankiales bacterium]|nr:putative integral rane protein SCJ12 [Frankiales bacterium]
MTTAIRHDTAPGLGALPLGRHTSPDAPGARSGLATVGLVGLRLALGFEFLWAFLDKLFGWGYATPSDRAWIHGGSPTSGFLSGAGGPLKGVFHSLSGIAAMDWLFMAGLLGIGAALLLGVALRPAAASGVLLLTLMWFATWPFAKVADGEATHSTNPLVDDHVVSAFALVVVALLAGRSAGYLGRRWSELSVVRAQPWLR